jgi:hypothetical protein
MTPRLVVLISLLLLSVLAPARADYLVLDGNRNPQTFKSLATGGGQIQQTVPSDPTAIPYSQSNPQYFNLLIGGFLPTIGQAVKANSIPVSLPSDPDIRPSPTTVTAVDTASTTSSGQNGGAIITGSPTAGSFVVQAVNGASTARVQLSGTWVGTLALEQSVDGGITYGATACHINGTLYSGSQFTGNGIFDCEVAGATHLRVRATAFVPGGTAVITPTLTSVTGVVKILNSVALKDNSSGAAATIKPASTAASPTDPALVVAISPNNPLTTSDSGTPGTGISQPAGGSGLTGWLSGIYRAVTGTLNVSSVQSGAWNVTPLGATSTDDSGTITTGGSYQTVIAASGSRKGCLIQNPTTATEVLNVKFGTMASPFTLLPGMSIGCNQGSLVLQDAVTAMAPTTAHAFAALAQ